MTFNSLISRKPNGVVLIVCSLLLFFAIGDHSLSYYDMLRWVITAGAIYSVVVLYDRGDTKFWAFAVIAFLFNPLFRVSLDREVWQIIDLVAAFIFLIPLGDKVTDSTYKIKPSRLTASGDLSSYIDEQNKIRMEYGKLIEDLMKETKTKYPAFVFPISLLPASKEDITEVLEEMERQAAESNDETGVNAAASGRVYLEQFIADEDAYKRNQELLDNPEWQKAIKKHSKKDKA